MTELREQQFHYQPRCGVIVYLKSLKNIRQLRHYGKIYYVSKKMKYVLLYINQEKLEETLSLLNKQNYVRKALASLKPWVKTDYHSKGEQ